MEKQAADLKVYYFALGIIVSLFTSMMPIFYQEIGLTSTQIGILLSIIYLGAFAQPILGLISDKSENPATLLKNLFMALMVLSVVLVFVSSFKILVFIVLAISVVRIALFSLSDSLVMPFCIKYQQNYGEIRRGASLSFGSALIIATPFTMLLGIRGFLLLAFLCALICFYIMQRFEYRPDKPKQNRNYVADVKEIGKSKAVIALLLFQMIFMGAATLKFSYQAIRLQELTGDTTVSAIALIFATLPEVFLLAFVSNRLKNIRFTTALLLGVCFNVIHMLTYVFCSSIPVLILIATFHGFCMAFYIPTYPLFLSKIVKPGVISTFFTIGGMMQSLISLVVSLAIITPIYTHFGSQFTFLGMATVALLSLIPLFYLRFKYNY